MKKITETMSTLVVKLQRFFSFASIIIMTLAYCSVTVMQVMEESFGKNWLVELLTQLTMFMVMGGIVFANIKNIKRPHVVSFIIEFAVICLFLLTNIYGQYLANLYQQEPNGASLAMNHFTAPIEKGDFSFVLDAFKLAWLPIVIVGGVYALRIKIYYAARQ